MICVYPADCTDFSTNGNGTLVPLSTEVTGTLNGEYELTLVHTIDETGKWQRLVERIEINHDYEIEIKFCISVEQYTRIAA